MTKTCIACKSHSAEEFINYGPVPLGNAFLRTPDVKDEYMPEMRVAVCTECNTVQQPTPPDFSFLEKDYRNYKYAPTKSSQAQVKNLAALGKDIVRYFGLQGTDLFLDIGCNDGAMLDAVKEMCRVLGVEPARDIGQMAKDKGIPVINEFFNKGIADRIESEYGKVDVATFTQVFQHIPDVNGTLESVVGLLKPEGGLVIEGRYFTETLRTDAYDTMYPEVITCATLTSMKKLLEKFGMTVTHAEKVNIYGGSLRVFAKKANGARPDATVADILEEEEKIEIQTIKPFETFAKNSFALRDQLRLEVDGIKKAGGRIAGYAAPSTGTTLLNFAGLGKELEYVVDDSDLKQGTYVPGTHQAVVPSETLSKDPVDHILLVAWRMANDIFPKIERYGVKRVVLPLPKVETISR